jgi:hypothetical protein
MNIRYNCRTISFLDSIWDSVVVTGSPVTEKAVAYKAVKNAIQNNSIINNPKVK